MPPTDRTPDRPGHLPPDPPPPRDRDVEALRRHTRRGHTKAAATWTGLVIGVVAVALLLVFILQNLDAVTLELLGWEFSLPLGVCLLLSAIVGAAVMALAGGVRILQIRRMAKRVHPNR